MVEIIRSRPAKEVLTDCANRIEKRTADNFSSRFLSIRVVEKLREIADREDINYVVPVEDSFARTVEIQVHLLSSLCDNSFDAGKKAPAIAWAIYELLRK